MNTLASPMIKSHFSRSSHKVLTIKKDLSEPADMGKEELIPSIARMSSGKLTRVSETRKKLKLLIEGK